MDWSSYPQFKMPLIDRLFPPDSRTAAIAAEGDAKECRSDRECCQYRSFKSAGKFGDATAASAMVHGISKIGLASAPPDLHFQVPAVRFLSHRQRIQQV